MSADEKFYDAVSELKRADHSIAVSLKYTRTVDVIKSIVERLINTIGFAFDAVLEKAKQEGKIKTIPKLPRQKTELLLELYPDDEFLQNYIEFYFVLRKISKAKYGKTQEFRRHVTMTARLDSGKSVELTIDIITDYFNRVKELLDYVARMINYGAE